MKNVKKKVEMVKECLYWNVFVIFGFPDKERVEQKDLDLRMSKNLRMYFLSELPENRKHLQSYRAFQMFSGRHLVKSRTLEDLYRNLEGSILDVIISLC